MLYRESLRSEEAGLSIFFSISAIGGRTRGRGGAFKVAIPPPTLESRREGGGGATTCFFFPSDLEVKKNHIFLTNQNPYTCIYSHLLDHMVVGFTTT
jgi:hypothetical protein